MEQSHPLIDRHVLADLQTVLTKRTVPLSPDYSILVVRSPNLRIPENQFLPSVESGTGNLCKTKNEMHPTKKIHRQDFLLSPGI